MPIWTKDKPPSYFPNAIATERGWENPDTGEVLVSIGGLAQAAGAPDPTVVSFGQLTYAQGGVLGVAVKFNEKVTVTAGASIVVNFSGTSGNQTLYAAAGQTAVQTVLFSKQVDNTTNATVPVNVAASAVLTFTGVVSNNQTVTLGSKVYTFQTTLTNVDGNVLIGANAQASINNLTAAINLSAGAGTTYAVATTAHPLGLTAVATSATVCTISAPQNLGAEGNAIVSTETITNATFAAGTFQGGVSNVIAATAATGTLTFTDQAIATQTATIGTKVYTYRASVVDVAASGTLTFSGNAANNNTVVIDGKTYTFKTTLTDVDGYVKIGEDAAESIENLVAAIKKDPAFSSFKYAASTVVHPTVDYTSSDATTLVVTAKEAGTDGNSITTSKTGANLSWGGATLAGGAVNNVDGAVKVGATTAESVTNLIDAVNLNPATAGIGYAALTVAQPESIVAAQGAGTTLTLTAPISVGAAANSYATTDTLANANFGAATLTGGVTAKGVLSIAAQTLGGTITETTGGTKASKTLTLTAIPLNNETVVIDGKTYTFKATLTDTDGFVLIGATAELSVQNLKQAITLDPVGTGTLYAASTTLHPTVTAVNSGADLVVTAKTAGTAGNSLAISETLTNGAWAGGASTLSGGVAVNAANKVITAEVAAKAGTRTVTLS